MAGFVCDLIMPQDTYYIEIMSFLSRRSSTHDAGPHLLKDVWALTATAILIVVLRIIAKLRIRKFGSDDLLMGFALVSKPFLSTLS
jgi:hypothetical protein